MFASLTLATLAFAQSPEETVSEQAQRLVETKVTATLAKKENARSLFSRAALPPVMRQVRVVDEAPKTDSQGQRFMAFVVDAQRGRFRSKTGEANWKPAFTGCVYLDQKEVFVKLGENEYQAPQVLWGAKPTAVPTHVCRPAPSTDEALTAR